MHFTCSQTPSNVSLTMMGPSTDSFMLVVYGLLPDSELNIQSWDANKSPVLVSSWTTVSNGILTLTQPSATVTPARLKDHGYALPAPHTTGYMIIKPNVPISKIHLSLSSKCTPPKCKTSMIQYALVAITGDCEVPIQSASQTSSPRGSSGATSTPSSSSTTTSQSESPSPSPSSSPSSSPSESPTTSPKLQFGISGIVAECGGDTYPDSSDPRLEGTTVELRGMQGNIITTTLTKPDGSYSFNFLPSGFYHVNVVLPEGYKWESDFNGLHTNIRLNLGNPVFNGVSPDPETGSMVLRSQNACVAKLETLPKTLPSLLAYAWEDVNRDGIKQSTEPYLANVHAEIFSGSLNGTSLGDGVISNTNNPGDLEVGRFCMHLKPPAGYKPTIVGGDSQIDQLTSSVCVDLAYSENVIIMAGFVMNEPSNGPPKQDDTSNPTPKPPQSDSSPSERSLTPTPEDPSNGTPKPDDQSNATQKPDDSSNATQKPSDSSNPTPGDSSNTTPKPEDSSNLPPTPGDSSNVTQKPDDSSNPPPTPGDTSN
eukprot:gene14754-17433_t